MAVSSWLQPVMRAFSIESGNPELHKAQFAALSRMIPMMYFMLVANAWVLTFTFHGKAPATHTTYTALGLTLICALRLVQWWKRKDVKLTAEAAKRELRRTNIIAFLLGVAIPAWGFLLFPYGDGFARAHVAFFLMISILSCMFCLIHTRSAALVVAAVTGVSFLTFFGSTGEPILIGMAINVALIVTASVVIVLVQSRDFAHMINARTEARRREQEQNRLLRMIDDMPIAVMTADPETFDINYVNKTSRRTLEPIRHLLPNPIDDLLGSSIDVFHEDPAHQRRILADAGNLPHRTRIRLGPEVLDLQVSAITGDDGSYLGPMLAWSVVTKEVEAEDRIRQLAHYDTLTGLANRNTFHEQFYASLARHSGTSLLCIDLDGFKVINDTRGHRIGDLLLRKVAQRLGIVCNEPGMTVARLGGDEFAVLIPHSDPERAEAFAWTLLAALGEPYQLEYDRHVRISASVGIALAPAHGNDGETLLSRADIALYAAKAAGKAAVRTFMPAMEATIQEHAHLEAALRIALEQRKELFVFYQPIIDIETGRVTTREALVRWHHPTRGWIAPGEFVPVAEGSGLIDQLGAFVLDRACRDAAGWDDGARVAVNISAGQLGKGTLVPAIQAALDGSGLSPGRLEVEVTETALLKDECDSIADLRGLRAIGVRVALDDFGTGYSSLAHLRLFPFDKIKIDGSFVRDAVGRADCAAVVKAVVELGRRLGVTTVAEGIETQAHMDCIRAEGCGEAQGYLIGRPAPTLHDAPRVTALNRGEPAVAQTTLA